MFHLATAAVVLSFTACQQGGQSDQPIVFEDVTAKSGIDFSHFNANRHSLLPEDVGSGLAFGDYDNDGDEDLYIVNFAGRLLTPREDLLQRPGNRLYRNNGDGTFSDVSSVSGVGVSGWNNACVWLDYDGDGWLDLAVSHYEGILLFQNQQNGAFKDVTVQTGLSSVRRYCMGMTAADYDRDGDLDLYVCGYIQFDREKAKNRPMVAGRPAVWTNPVSRSAAENVLLQNNGDGTFSNQTEVAGVADPIGKSMMAVFSDFNNDSWPDIYVGNDVSTPDALFLNLQNGSFTNVAGFAGTLDYRASMGIAVADFWGRGWLDLFTTHWVAEDHALWKNISAELEGTSPVAFEDLTPQIGLLPKPTALVGWGCGLYDLDNDGHLDLFLVNGSTIEDELTRDVLINPKLLPQTAQVFRWDPQVEKFVDLGPEAGSFFEEHHVSRGTSFADYDRDGRMDVAINQHNGRAQILRNIGASGSHWLRVKAVGAGKNRFAVGGRVRVHANGQTQMREILCGSGYLGSDSLISHFGLGSSRTAAWVEVQYPSGVVRRKTNVTTDKLLVIEE